MVLRTGVERVSRGSLQSTACASDKEVIFVRASEGARGGAGSRHSSRPHPTPLSAAAAAAAAAQHPRLYSARYPALDLEPLPPYTIRCYKETAVEEEADDVIDLGAPRRRRCRPAARSVAPRPRRFIPPNPRLYPGPKSNPRRVSSGRKRRSKRTLRRPVPNSRLYRPAPPRALRPRALDTASRVALCSDASSPRPPPPPASPHSTRLVVTIPRAQAGARYRPASEHFRVRAASTGSGASTPPAARVPPARAMDSRAAAPAPTRHSASPEDRSDGNDPSAPSEFLAEFLSAIMRRQYAEALKYCRLILQYEPHNATARGFYPLLRHKLRHRRRSLAADSSGDSGADSDALSERDSPSPSHFEEPMEHSEGGMESEASASMRSDLELDSSEPSLELSRRSESASCRESTDTGTASGSRSDTDDNGNAPPHPPPHLHRDPPPLPLLPDDLDNDNAAATGSGEPHHSARSKPEIEESATASLRRLRAHFACSIK